MMMNEIVEYFVNGTLDHVARWPYFFFAVSPQEIWTYTKGDATQVPEYFIESYVLALILIHLEEFCKLLTGTYARDRFHDRAASYIIISIVMIVKTLVYKIGLSIYMWIHENYRVCDLPTDSLVTWVVCFLWIDFHYYWTHRARHQVNILWADHQIHHSSEDYNLNVPFRIHPIEVGVLFFYYVTVCGPFIPPTVGLVHMQLVQLYQFMLHLEVIPYLGAPVEWIFNTPSHHRVHHGRTRDCIDKNFGATLIIWDRIFGTFQPEAAVVQKPIVYGLVHPIKTFNPVSLMFFYYGHVFRLVGSREGWKNKLKTLFYGPGWDPDQKTDSILGDLDQVPLVLEKLEPKFDIPVPWWFHWYTRIGGLMNTSSFYFVLSTPGAANWFLLVILGMLSLLDGYVYHLCITRQNWIPLLSTVRCAGVLHGYMIAIGYVPPVVDYLNQHAYLWIFWNIWIGFFVTMGLIFLCITLYQVSKLFKVKFSFRTKGPKYFSIRKFMRLGSTDSDDDQVHHDYKSKLNVNYAVN